MIRHTSYRTTIFRDGASVLSEFCMKEGLPWPCDTELRDREIATVVQQRDLAEARVGDLRAALDVAERWHDTIAKRDGCDGCELSVALATAKETP
jgi:hypothetical protein